MLKKIVVTLKRSYTLRWRVTHGCSRRRKSNLRCSVNLATACGYAAVRGRGQFILFLRLYQLLAGPRPRFPLVDPRLHLHMRCYLFLRPLLDRTLEFVL